MLLVIHNLPKTMRFYEVKKLILDKCGLEEVILDNFTIEGDYKRVTVGLADEGDAALLVRKINGLYMDGCQLFVEDVRQKKSTEQPYRPVENPHVPQFRPENKVQYNRQDDRMTSQPMMEPMISVPPVPMAYSNLPFYMSPIQVGFGRNGTLFAIEAGKVVVTCEKFDPHWDHTWVKRIYAGREQQTIFKKYFNVIPEPQHNRFKLIDEV